ncbi:MAG: TlpA disulfide reductase family protein [Natronomonas sp.]|uniref:TlpA family protein disulfide reductase n=1 Tax=Natronomonas sp. TaxID=2184060 RepID=UPI00286FDF44|nr:TlpA disulfide reductase family protein [Natronomonas sp.]MDR9431491.1 TlpA disulfide reductase family protein [Natronomonas sp.]
MRRRELLAGVASVGALGAAGAIAIRGLPSPGGESGTANEGDGESREPIEIETIDAPGSREGTISLPSTGEPSFVDFFGTWCPPCEEQMPALVEAHDRLGDEVRFVSVTTEDVGGAVSEEYVADWWAEHDGNWTVGVDSTAELAARYLAGGYPSAVAIDASGTVQWSESGVKTTDELVAGIERALDDE